MAREERARRHLLGCAASDESLQQIKSLLMLGQGTRPDQVSPATFSRARSRSLVTLSP